MTIRKVSTPKLPTTPAPAKAAATQQPAPTAAALSYQRRAEQEWERAPQARGWGHRNAEMRELSLTPDDMTGDRHDVRAFTKEQWMAFRVPDLHKQDQNRPLPHWR